MLGIFKRKKKKDKDSKEEPLSAKDKNKNLKKTTEEELEKEKKRKKPPEGPNWPAITALFISVVIGLFFFLYGRISQMGLAGLVPSFHFETTPKTDTNTPQKPVKKKPRTNSDGIIIFEKE